MSLSTKHYERIAAAIKTSQVNSGNSGDDLIVQHATVHRVVLALSREFANDDPNFDPRRFIEACL